MIQEVYDTLLHKLILFVAAGLGILSRSQIIDVKFTVLARSKFQILFPCTFAYDIPDFLGFADKKKGNTELMLH